MTRSEFEAALTAAGNKYDGHVTIGSLQEQMKVIEALVCFSESISGTLPESLKEDLRRSTKWPKMTKLTTNS